MLFAWFNVPHGAWENAEFLREYEDDGQLVNVAPGSSNKVEISIAKTP